MKFHKRIFDNTFTIFLVIAVLYAIGNFLWWRLNTPIILVSESAIHFNDIFEQGYLFFNAPLVTWLMRAMFLIFDKNNYDLQVIFVNYIFFLIPLYFVYKIGTELKDKETGNIAMILFSLVPAVYGMSRQYGHQDYHIIAGITFNIYCLIKTDYFRNRKWTIWYGISVGLGLMIKDAFLAYFFVPFMYIAIKGLKDKADRAKVINIFISVILGSLIAGWHYFRIDIIDKILHDPIIEAVPIFAFSSLRVMTTGLWEDLLSLPIFIIFIIGLIYFIWKYKGKYKNIILLWFFVPWLIIMFMPHRKLPEYGAGFIPAMVLTVAVFISYINKSYIKKTVILLLIVIGVFQYILILNCFNIKLKFNSICYNIKSNVISYSPYYSETYIDFFEILKKYKDNKFYYLYSNAVDSELILMQMFLNNFYFKEGKFDTCQKEMFEADIILMFGESNIEYILEDMLKCVNAANVTTEFKNELLKRIEHILDEIQKKYHKIDVFYLDGIGNKVIEVKLLGRKDKFPQFSQ